MLNLEAPSSLFGPTVNSSSRSVEFDMSNSDISSTPQKVGKSKFSLSSFGNKFKKNTSINFDQSSQKIDEGIESTKRLTLKVSEYRKTKTPYTYDSNRGLPFLDESKRRRINWNDIISKQKPTEVVSKIERRKIEQKVEQDDVFDLFDSKENIIVQEDSSTDSISKQINKILESLKISEILLQKGGRTNDSKVSIEDFIDIIYNTFEYMSSEERGRILLNIIFGCLISRSKFLGNGGKTGSSGFKDIITSLSKIKRGGSSELGSKIYNSVLELIISDKLSSYRSNLTAANQVQTVVTLLNKINKSEMEVYFPSNISFSDPVPVFVIEKGKQVLNIKSIPLVGTPTLENLQNFFITQVTKPQTQKGKNNNKNKEEDNYYFDQKNDYFLNQEDDMIGRGQRGKSSQW